MSAVTSRSLVLISVCLFLLVGWTTGQDAKKMDLGSDLKLELKVGPRPEEEGSYAANLVPDVEDDEDLGLNPRHRGDAFKRPVTADVDNTITQERHRVDPVHRSRRPITSIDIVDDVDLGLRHHRMDKEPIPSLDTNNENGAKKLPISNEIPEGEHNNESPISDANIKNDADLGLIRRMEKVAKTEPISMEDGNTKYEPHEDLKHDQIEPTISDAHIKDDVDLGLNRIRHRVRHNNKNETRDRLQRIVSRKQRILDMKLKRNAFDLGQTRDLDVQRRRQNTTYPKVVIPQARRSIQKFYQNLNEQKKQTEEYDQVVKRLRLAELQSKIEREQQRSSVPGNLQGDSFCHRYDVDGCSVPFGLPFFFKELFTNSCDRHDICYGCGSKYKIDRKTCDYAFKQNMWKACVAKYQTTDDVVNDVTDRKSKRERLIIKLVENLQDQFTSILKRQLGPAMLPYTTPEEAMAKLEDRAKFVQSSVIREWVNLLKQQLYYKKSFASSSKQKFSHLLYERNALHMTSESRNEFSYDINLTMNLCDDVLYNTEDTVVSKRVKLSCKEVDLMSCYFFDQVYFWAVRIFASFSYHDSPEFYCGEPFVKKCLPPTDH